MAALLASISVFLFDAFLPVSAETASIAQMSKALSNIILIFSGLIVGSAVLVWFVFPESKGAKDTSIQKLSLKGVKEVIKRRSVWLQAFILLCAYVGYKCTDVFSIYASDVMGYDDVNSAHIGTISFWMRPIAAVAAGFLGDRIHHSRMGSICFVIIIMGSLTISSGFLSPNMGLFIIFIIATTSAGIYGLRGLYYALFQEAKVPLIYTGSAVGFVSVIGYTPDIFLGPLTGIIDIYPGELGYQIFFGILAVF